LLNFFCIVMGERPYSDLALLIQAVFDRVGTDAPVWASPERLKQEMGRRAKRWPRLPVIEWW
jgi:hypothetical protein